MNPDVPVLLTVRGARIPADLESARILHNDTAGSEPGIAAARGLGDLSHSVFAPCLRAGALSSARPEELLFVDNWVDAQGIGAFFSNPEVQRQGGALFSSKEPVVWMRPAGAFSFHLPAPKVRSERWLGVIRAVVRSPEAAIAAFRQVGTAGLRDARRRGQVSHEIFFRMGPPGAPGEVIGLDSWSSLDGLVEHYSDRAKLAPLGEAFAGPPDATVWEQPAGHWSEW